MRTRIPAKAPRHHTCPTLLPVFPVLFMTILLLLCSVPACAEIRMIDLGALLRAYGFPDGQRNILGVIRLNIKPEVAEITGAIEGAPNLDSNLEVITAARYGSVGVTP